MRLIEPAYTIDSMGSTVFSNEDHQGSCMFIRPDTGLISIKVAYESNTGLSKIMQFNPYTKTQFSKSTASFPRNYIYGWDYDFNRMIVAYNQDTSDFFIYEIQEGTEIVNTLTSWNPASGPHPKAIYRVNNEYVMLMANGTIHKRATDGTLIVIFSAPFLDQTSSMHYGGIGTNLAYFTKSVHNDRSIGVFFIPPGSSGIKSVERLNYPSEITTNISDSEKVNIAVDAYNHMWIGMYAPDDVEFNIWKVDITPVSAILIADTFPSSIPGNGESIAIVTGRVLNDAGLPKANTRIRCSISGTALTSSTMLDGFGNPATYITGTTNASGTAFFDYLSPIVTGTQYFNLEVLD